MLAPREIPAEYIRWNKLHHAPWGISRNISRVLRRLFRPYYITRFGGPFGVLPNSYTRLFEYPWAIEQGEVRPGMSIIDLGGGASGFPFVLNRLGATVQIVDPSDTTRCSAWLCSQEVIDEMNSALGTSVRLLPKKLGDCDLAPNSFDRVVSISAIEHFDPDDVPSAFDEVWRILRRGGLFILTADLFLDLVPFTSRIENVWGRNYHLGQYCFDRRFELVAGRPGEIYGSPTFSAARILARRDQCLVGGGHVMAQCMVLRKA